MGLVWMGYNWGLLSDNPDLLPARVLMLTKKMSFSILCKVVIFIFMFLFDVPVIKADIFNDMIKVTASDGDEVDLFGSSVSVSGNTAIIGAHRNDDAGNDSGSAYLFGLAGNEIIKLTANDASAGNNFGYSVSISGTRAIVGAPRESSVISASGAAYIFDVTTGNQISKLKAPDPENFDQFGTAVAISGNTAVISALYDDDDGFNTGSAYLFDITTGNQIAKLTANDAVERERFGFSVAINENWALVGAVLANENGIEKGAVYVFDVKTGNQLFKLTSTDGRHNDTFGNSVAVSGNTAVIGARNYDYISSITGRHAGSAYLFDLSTGSQLAKLLPDDSSANDKFGYSVAISDDVAYVASPFDDYSVLENTGSVYVFDVSTGNQIGKLSAPDEIEHLNFGYSIASSDDKLIVGARGFDIKRKNSVGAAYIYVPEPSTHLLAIIGIISLVVISRRRKK